MTIEQQARFLAMNHQHYNALLELGLLSQFSALMKLVKLERKAHRAAENWCNLENFNYESVETRIEKQVKELFRGKLPQGFFINSDPRGYALKIESEFTPEGLQTDWGGYGLLAPIDL